MWFWLISSKRFRYFFCFNLKVLLVLWRLKTSAQGIQILQSQGFDSIKLAHQLWILGHPVSAETQQRTNHLNMGQCHDHRLTILSSQSLVAEIEIIWIICIPKYLAHSDSAIIASLSINRLVELRAFSWILNMLCWFNEKGWNQRNLLMHVRWPLELCGFHTFNNKPENDVENRIMNFIYNDL